MIEVHMHASHDVSLEVVLNMSELSGEITHMVVVHEGDRRNRLMRVAARRLVHELIADQITERLGTRRVFPASDKAIEIDKKMAVKRHAEADKLLHKAGCYVFVIRVTHYSGLTARGQRPDDRGLFSAHGNVEDSPLPIDEQQCEIV